MVKLSQQIWSILFAVSVGVLMLAVLLMRSEPMPFWVLIVYPVAGGMLGLAASRTSPSVEQIAWLEAGTIAAAAVVVLAALVNVLVLETLLRHVSESGIPGGQPPQQVTFFLAPAIAVLFWWALQRRLNRLRLASAERYREVERAGIPAE